MDKLPPALEELRSRENPPWHDERYVHNTGTIIATLQVVAKLLAADDDVDTVEDAIWTLKHYATVLERGL